MEVLNYNFVLFVAKMPFVDKDCFVLRDSRRFNFTFENIINVQRVVNNVRQIVPDS